MTSRNLSCTKSNLFLITLQWWYRFPHFTTSLNNQLKEGLRNFHIFICIKIWTKPDLKGIWSNRKHSCFNINDFNVRGKDGRNKSLNLKVKVQRSEVIVILTILVLGDCGESGMLSWDESDGRTGQKEKIYFFYTGVQGQSFILAAHTTKQSGQ